MAFGDIDPDEILRRAEASLAQAPSKLLRKAPKHSSRTRFAGYLLVVLLLAAICCLPSLKFGGDEKVVEQETPGPLFQGKCGGAKRRVRTPWPLEGTSHVSNIVVHKSAEVKARSYAHMPMLHSMRNGTLIMAFQASSAGEGANDQHIAIAYAYDYEGSVWSTPEPLEVNRAGPLWSPVLHRDPHGHVWLFYTEGRECKYSGDPVKWMPGGDLKVTMWLGAGPLKWRTPRTILTQAAAADVPIMLSNRLVVLSTGEWVLPYWTEKHSTGTCEFDGEAEGHAAVLVSLDEGWTWVSRGKVTSPQTWLIESALVELKNATLLMLFRTVKGAIFQASSDDKGFSWSTPEAAVPALPNPESKVGALRLQDGTLALAFNNHARLKAPHRRCHTNLDISVSKNEGNTWTRLARLEGTQEAGLQAHYPSMHQIGCTLYVAYSKFYHEEFSYRTSSNTSATHHLGIHVAALDLR